MQKLIQKIISDRTKHVLRVQSVLMKELTDWLHRKELLQLMPVMLAPETDPLCHSVLDATIDYYGQKLHLTKSMILHKQLALMSPHISGIYIMSPNIRLETKDCADSKRHLIEFTQLDIELKDKSKLQFMELIEAMVTDVISAVKESCSEELKRLGRTISVPERPFRVYESIKLRSEYGPDYERIVSKKESSPFWILDLKREFYDKEDAGIKDYYHNYDLVWPEGYEEALSGGEREYKHRDILRKMKERDMDISKFAGYLELAKRGLLQRTVGGGIGIERFVRYVCGLDHVDDVTLFSRKPGQKVLF